MLIPLFAASMAIHVLSNAAGIAIIPDGDELQKSMQIRSGYEYLTRAMCMFCMFNSPSFSFTIIYLLTYSGGVAWLSILFGDLSSPVFVETLSQQPIYVVVNAVVFYLLQRRELKRFYQQQDASEQG